jgi:hypothetical protein
MTPDDGIICRQVYMLSESIVLSVIVDLVLTSIRY